MKSGKLSGTSDEQETNVLHEIEELRQGDCVEVVFERNISEKHTGEIIEPYTENTRRNASARVNVTSGGILNQNAMQFGTTSLPLLDSLQINQKCMVV